MKKYLLIFTMFLISSTAWSQETVTLSGGYVLARLVDYNTEAEGFRITGTYEIGPMKPKRLIHGFALGYFNTNSSVMKNNLSADVTVRSWPMYYAPKFMIGSEKAMVFVRGTVGIQFAKFKVEGEIEGEDKDWGFHGGIGLGGMVYLNKRIFLNAEYEWAYMTNNYYLNGILNTFQAGIGVDL